ncbi:hypothetical protein ACH3VR_01190 [Microbacterium sp. B2969]|uniref:PEP-CTERM sorting domain-containing protein n=1 Tax=Microbacterium alkaliflavum TaxID=3248839 RepID=A0ABW7Q2B4_9MICO
MMLDPGNAQTWTVMSQTTAPERVMLAFLSLFTILSRRRSA